MKIIFGKVFLSIAMLLFIEGIANAQSSPTSLPPELAVAREALRECQTFYAREANQRRGAKPGQTPPDPHSATGELLVYGDSICGSKAPVGDPAYTDHNIKNWIHGIGLGLAMQPVPPVTPFMSPPGLNPPPVLTPVPKIKGGQ